MPHLSNYKNKYFSVLGDSMSTFEGCSVPESAVYYDLSHKLAADVLTPADTWWGQVIDRLGGRLLVNNSFSGSTVCWHPLYEIQSYGCSDERTAALGRDGISPDVIMVLLGTNDWGCGTRVVYDPKLTADPNDPSIFLPAYGQMLQKLKTNYPNAEIWCMTLPISRCSAQPDFSFPYCYRGRHISEYCDAIRDCASQAGCRLIDLNSHGEAYDTLDGFHPTADGMKTISNGIIQQLKLKGDLL